MAAGVCEGRQDLQGATLRGTLDAVPFVKGPRGGDVGERYMTWALNLKAALVTCIK